MSEYFDQVEIRTDGDEYRIRAMLKGGHSAVVVGIPAHNLTLESHPYHILSNLRDAVVEKLKEDLTEVLKAIPQYKHPV